MMGFSVSFCQVTWKISDSNQVGLDKLGILRFLDWKMPRNKGFNPNGLSLVVYPIIYEVLYILSAVQDFFHQQ